MHPAQLVARSETEGPTPAVDISVRADYPSVFYAKHPALRPSEPLTDVTGDGSLPLIDGHAVTLPLPGNIGLRQQIR